MCGAVKPTRVECGSMHCRLPGQAGSEAHQHSAGCQVDLPALGYRVMETTDTDLATHVMLGRQSNE